MRTFSEGQIGINKEIPGQSKGTRLALTGNCLCSCSEILINLSCAII